MAQISWNFIVSVNLFLTLLWPFSSTLKYEPYYHVYVWGNTASPPGSCAVMLSNLYLEGVSALTSFIIAGANLVGPSGDGTCVYLIRSSYKQVELM